MVFNAALYVLFFAVGGDDGVIFEILIQDRSGSMYMGETKPHKKLSVMPVLLLRKSHTGIITHGDHLLLALIVAEHIHIDLNLFSIGVT
ncbi:hypothetical protein ACJX0J_029788, partial [Zea mays]